MNAGCSRFSICSGGSSWTSSGRGVRSEGEVIALRHQLNVLRRRTPKRPALRSFDRFILVLLYRLAPTSFLDAMTIVRPETIMRWHRAGFHTFWRWKSRRRPGRPKVALEVRQLILQMSLANPFWGAPRIHGELLKLGIDVGQTSVAKYMVRHRRPPSQGWRTFLLNHVDGIASIDLFVVPTISFQLLLRVADPPTRSEAHPVARRHCACRMDRPASHGGMWLGERATLSHP